MSNSDQASFARVYCTKVQAELDFICGQLIKLLNNNLLENAFSDEKKVFYHKIKADYYQHLAKFKADEAKKAAAESATRHVQMPPTLHQEIFLSHTHNSPGPCSHFLGVPV